ncbi:Lsr2 family DNA-binding protein [Actinomadura napierensis]
MREIRAWAKSNGIQVNNRGRIPRRCRRAVRGRPLTSVNW